MLVGFFVLAPPHIPSIVQLEYDPV